MFKKILIANREKSRFASFARAEKRALSPLRSTPTLIVRPSTFARQMRRMRSALHRPANHILSFEKLLDVAKSRALRQFTPVMDSYRKIRALHKLVAMPA